MNKKGYGSKKEIKKIAESVWEEMMGFSKYAFPKAHATSYAIIANATQYLKVNYPTEFFCAHLQQADDEDHGLIRNISKKIYKVKYSMPEINLSKDKFIIANNKIVWSLTSIKGIGNKAATEIISKQPFSSFHDFFERINKRIVNVRVVRLLITTNTFKKFDTRNNISKTYSKLRKDKEYTKKSREEWKLEASKIMTYYEQSVRELFRSETSSAITHEEFMEKKFNKRVIVVGTIESLREIKSKRGMMIIITLSDSGDNFSIVCWNEYYEIMKNKDIKLKKGMAIRVSGHKKLSNRNEEQITLGREKSSYIKILG